MAHGVLGPLPMRDPPFVLLTFPRPFPIVPSSRSIPKSPPSMAPAHCSCSSPQAMASATSNPSPSSMPSLLVFSGGTAFNGVVEELKKVTTRVAHVLPVSDDGGSTAEIVRVLGGPAVGDIRSRCLRLSDDSTSEALAVRILLGHRLPLDSSQAKLEWYKIVEGEHYLWDGVSRPYKETIHAFLAYFQNQILRQSNGSFCFSNDIPTESLVLPVISTNDRHTLGCELQDGTIIRGQNEISHPTNGCTGPVSKDCDSSKALPSRIKRVFYMSSEGSNLLHEVFPVVNPTVLEQLSKVDCVVYAMGSLFTSICPSLVLHGIGEIIASRNIPKVLLLNGSHDRETTGLSASGFVTAITDALNRTHGDPDKSLKNHPSEYINALLVPRDGHVPVDVECLAIQGIFHVVYVDSVRDPKVGIVFEPRSLIKALTDLIHERRDVSASHAVVLMDNSEPVC
ncbi:uncharacterized protein YNL011C isoform X2 [Typha latifolia]|uniref:uncharacterized protein YNL011C isoform X2 n=1 Tax=Typha latifolia TaxID=4733 RepID=UPI003C2E14FA